LIPDTGFAGRHSSLRAAFGRDVVDFVKEHARPPNYRPPSSRCRPKRFRRRRHFKRQSMAPIRAMLAPNGCPVDASAAGEQTISALTAPTRIPLPNRCAERARDAARCLGIAPLALWTESRRSSQPPARESDVRSHEKGAPVLRCPVMDRLITRS